MTGLHEIEVVCVRSIIRPSWRTRLRFWWHRRRLRRLVRADPMEALQRAEDEAFLNGTRP